MSLPVSASRALGRLIVASVVALAGLTATALPSGGATPARIDPREALSGTAAVTSALAQGRLHRTPSAASAAPAAPRASVLANVRASLQGSQPANETPIAINPANPQQIAAGANDYNCGSFALTGVYTSDDGGATFPHQHCQPVLNAGENAGGDPIVAYNTAGRLYAGGLSFNASTNQGELEFQVSADNGTTWSAPHEIVGPSFAGGFTDKPWMAIDTSTTSPRKNAIYVSATEFDASFSTTRISVSHSTDGGKTWTRTFPSTAQASPSVDQFSDLAIASNGVLYVSWMRCTAGAFRGCSGRPATEYAARSTDGGSTWSTPVAIHGVTLPPGPDYYGDVPGTNERLNDIPVIDVDRSAGARAGTLYELDTTYTSGMTRLELSSSTNGGATWSTPVFVYPAQASDTFFPWLSVNRGNGALGVTYMYRNAGTYRERVAISTNGGASFAGNVAIATADSSFTSDGFGGAFIGDYTGNAWAGRTLYASWTDTRTGIGQDFVGGLST